MTVLSETNFTRPENELVVLAAHPQLQSLEQERFDELLAANVDWQYLIKLTNEQGVFGLLYEKLRTCSFENVPISERPQLEAIHFKMVFNNNVLANELVAILRLFKAEAIPVIPLKGPTLAQLIYNDLELRMFADLDMLVPKKHIERAREILMMYGYEYTDKQASLNENRQEQWKHHYELVRNQYFHAELHWMLHPSKFSSVDDTEHFWKSVKPVTCLGETILVPRNEELLLYLCRHGARHLWQLLKWLTDIAMLIEQSPDLDWKYVLNEAERSQSKRKLLLGLGLSVAIFDSQIPANITRQIDHDMRIQQMIGEIARNIRMQAPIDEQQSISEHHQLMEVSEGPIQRIHYLVRILQERRRPNERDQQVIELSGRLSFLYRILRPIRLVFTYGPTMLKRIF